MIDRFSNTFMNLSWTKIRIYSLYHVNNYFLEKSLFLENVIKLYTRMHKIAQYFKISHMDVDALKPLSN